MTPAKPKQPVRYSPTVEKPKVDEAKTKTELAQTFKGMISKTHEDLGHAQRGVHAKSHGLLVAELTVVEDLPPELAQGIFKKPGTFPAIVRLSAIPADPLRDSVSLPRGFAVKVIGVTGKRLPGSQGQVTQDFLLANGPAFAAPTAKKFHGTLKLLARTTDRLEWAKAALSAVLRPLEMLIEAVGGESATIKMLGGYPKTHPLGERYFTQAAFRFGDFMAKLDVVPASENFKALTGKKIDFRGRHDALRDEVRNILRRQGGTWMLRAQLCRSLKANPIEDASKAWPEKGNPYLAVAMIKVQPQDSWSKERARKLEDELSFSPWHGIVAHQPIGNVNRARKLVYDEASKLRAKLNHCPIHEPKHAPRADAQKPAKAAGKKPAARSSRIAA
jgi:hypothetical protein